MLNSASLGVILLLFFLIVPIVIRVVNEKSKVMKGFAYVKKKEITEILTWASAFDVHSSAKSLKLLAETSKDKVYEIMKMQQEKKKENDNKHSQKAELEKNNKLRNLIRNIFKFDDENSPVERKDTDEIENSLVEKKTFHESRGSQQASKPSEKDGKPNVENFESPDSHKEGSSVNDSVLPLNAILDIPKEVNEEKIFQKRKKESLAKIE